MLSFEDFCVFVKEELAKGHIHLKDGKCCDIKLSLFDLAVMWATAKIPKSEDGTIKCRASDLVEIIKNEIGEWVFDAVDKVVER